MPAGRPLKFTSVKDLEQKIADYFTECEGGWEEEIEMVPLFGEKGKHQIRDGRYLYEEVTKMVKKPPATPTISGLAVALDTSRETLLNYEAREEFFDTIKRAKQTIEAMTEALLVNGGAQPAGVIFNLKNNYGWKDKQEFEHSGDSPIKVLLRKYDLTEDEGDAGETTQA